MKRFGNLYGTLCSYDHIELAYKKASRGKTKRPEVRQFASDLEANLRQIQSELINHTYQTSEYQTFRKYEPKERLIFKLPFRDRIVHWAIMLILEPIWVSTFTRDTYACIKNRGIHPCKAKLERDLRKDPEGTQYCLKVDIQKFYPSIDHDILKEIIRRKLKDPELLWLLDGIIDSSDGVPIGNYLSQYLANLYLSELDHLLKEEAGVRYYYRYADDLVLLDGDKGKLHGWLVYMNHYLHEFRRLSLKPNFQVFEVTGEKDPQGIDFVGYRFFHTHTVLRKSIKQAMCRKSAKIDKKNPNLSPAEKKRLLCSHYGWAVHCNSKNLLKQLGMVEIKKFDPDKYKPKPDPERKKKKFMDGDRINVKEIFDKNITILGWVKEDSHWDGDRIKLHFEVEEDVIENGQVIKKPVRHITFFWSDYVYDYLTAIEEAEEDPFPMRAKFITQRVTLSGSKEGRQYALTAPDD